MMKSGFMAVTLAAALAAAAAGDAGSAAEAQFPFDQVLNLDVAPMRPTKRKPSLTVAPNGAAVIDLWCKTIEGRVEVGDSAITITPAELPEALPDVVSNGQCTPDRMRADESLREALSHVSAWRRQGAALLLSGPAALRFYASTN
jgi:heat shock protein HslJ